MRRLMFAAAFVLSGAASAQDAKPAQPPVPAPKVAVPAQPNPFARPATATQMAKLEEEFETLEAHREVKKGHVRAAELGVRAAELEVEHLTELATRGIVPKSEMQKAKVAVEAAKVQVEIRVAELKEVDVKIKYAKKRLEEAKAAGVRPAPGGRGEPKAIDPPPLAAELKAKLNEVTAELAKKADALKKADEVVKQTAANLELVLRQSQLGIGDTSAIKAIEVAAVEANVQLDELKRGRKSLEDEAEALRKKLNKLAK